MPSHSARDLPLAVAIVVAAFCTVLWQALRTPGIDFWRPRAAVLALAGDPGLDVYSRPGRERTYDLALRRPPPRGFDVREQNAALGATRFDAQFLGYRGVDVVHSPVLLSFVRLFSWGGYQRDYVAFVVTSIASCLLSIMVICRVAGFSFRTSAVIAGALALTFEPESAELQVANVNNLQLALVALFLLLERRAKRWSDVASGGVLGIAVLFKPNLAPVAGAVVLTWIGGRLWHKCLDAAIGLLLGAAVALGVSAAMVSPAAFQRWFSVLPELAASSQPLAWGNLSLSHLLSDRSGVDLSVPLLAAEVAVFAAIALRPLWSRRGSRQLDHERRTLVAASTGAAIMLLSSRLVWVHYFVLAVPLLIVVARAAVARGRAWVAAAAFVSMTTGFLGLGTSLTDSGMLFECLVLNAAVLLLSGWAIEDLWRSGTLPADVENVAPSP